MFGFSKKKDKAKKRSTLDKLIMGAIVGGAVGSVIGMTIAPKSGKETREYLTQKGKDLYEKGKELKGKLDGTHGEDHAPAVGQKRRGFFGRILAKVFTSGKKQNGILAHEERLKKIPRESIYPEEQNSSGPKKNL